MRKFYRILSSIFYAIHRFFERQSTKYFWKSVDLYMKEQKIDTNEVMVTDVIPTRTIELPKKEYDAFLSNIRGGKKNDKKKTKNKKKRK